MILKKVLRLSQWQKFAMTQIFPIKKMMLPGQGTKLCHCLSKSDISSEGIGMRKTTWNIFFFWAVERFFVLLVHDCSVAARLHFTDSVKVWLCNVSLIWRNWLKIWLCTASRLFWSLMKIWLKKKSHKDKAASPLHPSFPLQFSVRSRFLLWCSFPLIFLPFSSF